MDVYVLRIVACSLGLVSSLCVLGVVVVASLGHEPPPTLGSIGSVCAGALVGILISPRQTFQSAPQADKPVSHP